MAKKNSADNTLDNITAGEAALCAVKAGVLGVGMGALGTSGMGPVAGVAVGVTVAAGTFSECADAVVYRKQFNAGEIGKLPAPATPTSKDTTAPVPAR